MSNILIAAAGGAVLLAYFAYTRPGVKTADVPQATLPPPAPVAPPPALPTAPPPPPPPCDYSFANINALRAAAGLPALDAANTTVTPLDSTPGVCTYQAKTTTTTTVTAPPAPTSLIYHCKKGDLYPNWDRTTCLSGGGSWVPGYSPSGPAFTYCASGGNVTTTTCQ
jgi:hypothetical protein